MSSASIKVADRRRGRTAFSAYPEPFVRGIADVTKNVAEITVNPINEVAAEIIPEPARQVNRNRLAMAGLVILSGLGSCHAGVAWNRKA